MLRSLLGRLVGLDGVRAWVREQVHEVRREIAAAEKHATAAVKDAKTLRKDLERWEETRRALTAEMKRQQEHLADLTTRLTWLEQLAAANDRTGPMLFSSNPSDLAATAQHARCAVQQSVLELEPGPHVVIDDVLPQAAYDRLLAALPPPEFFVGGGDQTKLDFRLFGEAVAPTASRVIWEAFETEIVEKVLMPALVERFTPVLESHYAQVLGPDVAAEAARLPKKVNGRIMLRRPGFRQAAHVDPKRSLITGILYLAKPGDKPEYGTHLYSVDRQFNAPSMNTYYLEPDGLECTFAKLVEYRPNRILAFLNSVAHGAEFPTHAGQRERCAYQFYVKPKDGALVSLLRRLPAERQKPWTAILD